MWEAQWLSRLGIAKLETRGQYNRVTICTICDDIVIGAFVLRWHRILIFIIFHIILLLHKIGFATGAIMKIVGLFSLDIAQASRYECVNLNNHFSYFSNKIYVVGTQNIQLNEFFLAPKHMPN